MKGIRCLHFVHSSPSHDMSRTITTNIATGDGYPRRPSIWSEMGSITGGACVVPRKVPSSWPSLVTTQPLVCGFSWRSLPVAVAPRPNSPQGLSPHVCPNRHEHEHKQTRTYQGSRPSTLPSGATITGVLEHDSAGVSQCRSLPPRSVVFQGKRRKRDLNANHWPATSKTRRPARL